MAEYDDSNSGALFKNERKEKDTHPDYRGSWTDANGVEHWLSCWIKTAKSGQSFMSLRATPKDGAPQAPTKGASQSLSADIPF